MIVERMLELILLNQLNEFIKNGNVDPNLLDSDKLMKRSKELLDDFLSNYTK